MKVFILLSVFAVALANECGKNQHYDSCGSACPLTCDNYLDPPKACILMCKPDCHCDEGYVKTEDGRCVKPEECPAKAEQCGENQHYESCGSACPLTCDNYLNPPKACILMCKSGCHCDEGYVKTKDGRCVKPQQCPAKTQECGENQHYESCGTACPLTCDNYQNPPKFCILMCNTGCHCDEGYVKTKDGRCVEPKQCPAKTEQVCGENERYYECGTACPLTCDNYSNPPKICPLMCVIGCQCEKGFVKTSDGRCVRPEDCPAQNPFEKTCLAKPDPGMCKAYMPMWYYDVNSQKCHEFIYGGCQGNSNRYATEEECMQNCGAVRRKGSAVSACDLPAEPGVCRGFFPKFYFDRTTGQCQKFVYGGCGGNENNFDTIEECQQTCGLQASSEVCSEPAEVGICRGYFPRYYYNEKTGRCQKFIYGGCGGNGNNFKTLEECQETCASA